VFAARERTWCGPLLEVSSYEDIFVRFCMVMISHNNILNIIIDLKVGERADPKTLKDLRFAESPLEIPAYHEGASARLPTHQAQVTSVETP
jgi:hypothetical protein